MLIRIARFLPCFSRFRLLQNRPIRTSIYRTDKEFLDPDLPLLAPDLDPFIHSDDGYFVNPVVERSSSGMAIVLLNLDRKPDDGGHGATEAQRLEAEWRGEVLQQRLKHATTYHSIGVHLEEKEQQFEICKSKSNNNKSINNQNKRKQTSGINSNQGTDNDSSNYVRKTGEIDKTSEARLISLTPVQQMLANYLRSTPLSFMGINMLYKKLRNHEVNSLQRVVVLSSLRRIAFAQGVSNKELLMISEASQLVGQLQPYALHLLRNLADLSWLLGTYVKPLLGYCPGRASNEGASLCLLTNHSSVYKNSEVTFDPTVTGLIPLGGLSHLLSRLPLGLGKYLALTGHRLSGVSLIHCGLAKYWVAPEALPFLELTSESQLEVSEHDAAGLIREHLLPPPDEKDTLAPWLPLIKDTFGACTTLEECVERLTEVRRNSIIESEIMWISDCLSRMRKRSLLAQTVTFSLLSRVETFREKLLQEAKMSRKTWHALLYTDRVQPHIVKVASEKKFVETLDERTLEYSLQLELRAMTRLLMIPETLERLRYAACEPWKFTKARPDPRPQNLDHMIWPVCSQYNKFSDITLEVLDNMFSPLPDDHKAFDFVAPRRSSFPLSQHPWIKVLHPDYNRKSKLDHDPMTERADRVKSLCLTGTIEAIYQYIIDTHMSSFVCKTPSKFIKTILCPFSFYVAETPFSFSQRLLTSASLTVLSDDRQTLRHAVAKLCESKILPVTREMDDAQQLNKHILNSLFDYGFMGIEVDNDYGGTELEFFDTILVIEEIAKVDASVAILVDIHNTLVTRALTKYGTLEQKGEFLPRLVCNLVGSFCLSENDAGSDAFSLKCRATKVSGGWKLSGNKQWISSSREAGLFIVFATEDPMLGYKGISAFIVEADQPGVLIGRTRHILLCLGKTFITSGRKYSKLGIRASSTCQITLEDVFVSEIRRLGEGGKGYQIAIDLLNEGRIGIGAQMVGISQGAFNLAFNYLHERKQFGQRIADFQGVQFQCANLATEIEASRLLVYNAAMMRANVQKNPLLYDEFVKVASMAKLHSSRTAQTVTSACIDLLGGPGFTSDLLAEKFYRDSKIGTIYEGTSNIQLMTIAKKLQKMRDT